MPRGSDDRPGKDEATGSNPAAGHGAATKEGLWLDSAIETPPTCDPGLAVVEAVKSVGNPHETAYTEGQFAQTEPMNGVWGYLLGAAVTAFSLLFSQWRADQREKGNASDGFAKIIAAG